MAGEWTEGLLPEHKVPPSPEVGPSGAESRAVSSFCPTFTIQLSQPFPSLLGLALPTFQVKWLSSSILLLPSLRAFAVGTEIHHSQFLSSGS